MAVVAAARAPAAGVAAAARAGPAARTPAVAPPAAAAGRAAAGASAAPSEAAAPETAAAPEAAAAHGGGAGGSAGGARGGSGGSAGSAGAGGSAGSRRWQRRRDRRTRRHERRNRRRNSRRRRRTRRPGRNGRSNRRNRRWADRVHICPREHLDATAAEQRRGRQLHDREVPRLRPGHLGSDGGPRYRQPFTANFTVAADGSGTHTSVQAALTAAASGSARRYILVKPGTYREVVSISGSTPITLYGADADATRVVIVNNRSAGDAGGTAQSATFTTKAAGMQLMNLTISNDFATPTSGSNIQAVALYTTGDKTVLQNVRLHGFQDTFYVDSPSATAIARVYIKDSFIEGDTDFIFGRAVAVFDGGTIRYLSSRKGTGSGVHFAPSTHVDNMYGFLAIRVQLHRRRHRAVEQDRARPFLGSEQHDADPQRAGRRSRVDARRSHLADRPVGRRRHIRPRLQRHRKPVRRVLQQRTRRRSLGARHSCFSRATWKRPSHSSYLPPPSGRRVGSSASVSVLRPRVVARDVLDGGQPGRDVKTARDGEPTSQRRSGSCWRPASSDPASRRGWRRSRSRRPRTPRPRRTSSS